MRAFLTALLVLGVVVLGVLADGDHHDEEENRPIVHSVGGNNLWNQGRPPEDWWAAIERTHGHVGPWNVLGLRIGQAALREFGTQWGRHELDIICYIPMMMPYSCMADGLVIGTGNSIGRLDIRLAEVMSIDMIRVAARRKDGVERVLVAEPSVDYMKRIESRKLHELGELSKQCIAMKEEELFRLDWAGDMKVDK